MTGSIGFVAHLGAAELTAVFIPIAIRQDQQQKFANRDGATALGAVKFRGLKVLKSLLWLRPSLLLCGTKLEWFSLHAYTPWI